jgi:hypothetical protein
VPAPGVEVLRAGDAGHDRGEDAFLVLRGEGRRVNGPAADDADGPLESDPVRVDTRFARRDVLSWAFPVTCSHLRWYASASSGAAAAVIAVIVVTRAITSPLPLPSPSRSGTSYPATRT